MIGSYYSYELIFLLEARTKRRGGLKRAFGIIVDFFHCEEHVRGISMAPEQCVPPDGVFGD